ncbi:DUF5753 domain-containing protein [Actinoplanes sp. NPDC049118]|uniref:DUF5753 domain-containing protein n=1 Tax=Actinoplanes sp. NPDC049118 TaxID=3155769 RepID=UPI0033FF7CCA
MDRDREWWASYRFTAEYPHFVDHEARAARIGVCQPLVVPGILQTRAYAEAATAAIIGLPQDHPAVLARVEVRLGRQFDLLNRMAGADPPRLTVVLDEIVLRRPVGGAAVLRAQLDALLELSTIDSIAVAVMPTRDGAHAGLGGYFELLRFPGGQEDVVFIESTATDSLLTGAAATAPYRDSLDRLVSTPGDGRPAAETIAQIRDSLG